MKTAPFPQFSCGHTEPCYPRFNNDVQFSLLLEAFAGLPGANKTVRCVPGRYGWLTGYPMYMKSRMSLNPNDP